MYLVIIAQFQRYKHEFVIHFKDKLSAYDVLDHSYFEEKNNNERHGKYKRASVKRSDNACEPRVVPSAEEITDEHLDRIALRSGNKQYCQVSGTTCHQCRYA